MTEYETREALAYDLASDEDIVDGAEGTESAVEPWKVSTPKKPEPDAATRIATLFAEMQYRRRVLKGALMYCGTPSTSAEINAFIDEAQRYNRSVYTSANLATLLLGAGALARVDEDGNPYEDGSNEPELVEIEGAKFWRVTEPPAALWVITEAGAAFLAADPSETELRETLASEPQYRDIYTRVLSLCDAEGGAATPVLADAVDNDPALVSPRMYVQYFIDRLEKAGALDWRDAWMTTGFGKELLVEVREDSAETTRQE